MQWSAKSVRAISSSRRVWITRRRRNVWQSVLFCSWSGCRFCSTSESLFSLTRPRCSSSAKYLSDGVKPHLDHVEQELRQCQSVEESVKLLDSAEFRSGEGWTQVDVLRYGEMLCRVWDHAHGYASLLDLAADEFRAGNKFFDLWVKRASSVSWEPSQFLSLAAVVQRLGLHGAWVCPLLAPEIDFLEAPTACQLLQLVGEWADRDTFESLCFRALPDLGTAPVSCVAAIGTCAPAGLVGVHEIAIRRCLQHPAGLQTIRYLLLALSMSDQLPLKVWPLGLDGHSLPVLPHSRRAPRGTCSSLEKRVVSTIWSIAEEYDDRVDTQASIVPFSVDVVLPVGFRIVSLRMACFSICCVCKFDALWKNGKPVCSCLNCCSHRWRPASIAGLVLTLLRKGFAATGLNFLKATRTASTPQQLLLNAALPLSLATTRRFLGQLQHFLQRVRRCPRNALKRRSWAST
mmetsp:Transcript_4823/g.10049  ORF Transcript_4823/g.10049 Transcript_4823/m.10049 type:complete len:460 (-) Transcript_4823:2376-3755(-)